MNIIKKMKYLINPEWLELYNYKKIESLIGKKTFKEISNFNDIRSIPQIIKTLNVAKIKRFKRSY